MGTLAECLVSLFLQQRPEGDTVGFVDVHPICAASRWNPNSLQFEKERMPTRVWLGVRALFEGLVRTEDLRAVPEKDILASLSKMCKRQVKNSGTGYYQSDGDIFKFTVSGQPKGTGNHTPFLVSFRNTSAGDFDKTLEPMVAALLHGHSGLLLEKYAASPDAVVEFVRSKLGNLLQMFQPCSEPEPPKAVPAGDAVGNAAGGPSKRARHYTSEVPPRDLSKELAAVENNSLLHACRACVAASPEAVDYLASLSVAARQTLAFDAKGLPPVGNPLRVLGVAALASACIAAVQQHDAAVAPAAPEPTDGPAWFGDA